MENQYYPKIAKVVDIKQESPQVKLFTLTMVDQDDKERFRFIPGQFVQVWVPGIGEAPFDLCSQQSLKDSFQVCVRKAGRVTKKIHELKVDDEVGIRGPFGEGFPIKEVAQKNLLLIGGGIGLITLKSLIEDFCDLGLASKASSYRQVRIFYGAKNKQEMIFKDRYKEWSKFVDLNISLSDEDDKKIDELSDGKVKYFKGLITDLFNKVEVNPDALVFLCGPPIMYKFCLKKLKEKGFNDANIYFALERRMHCAVGTCQHCAVGPYYTCKDGPVFGWDKIKHIPGAI